MSDTTSSVSTKKPFLSNRQYDVLKWIAQIFLPALGTLYFGLAGIWNLPAPEKVLGTIIVCDTFLGVLLGLTTRAYNNADNPAGKYTGTMLQSQTEDGKLYTLDLNVPPQTLKIGDDVLLKVKPAHAAGS